MPLVDQIESRLDLLLNIAQTNCNAVETISSTYDNIREMELESHHLGDSVTRTQAWLHKLSTLHEKSVFLESLISQGDYLSSKALLDAISAEYQQLLGCREYITKNQEFPWEKGRGPNTTAVDSQDRGFTMCEEQVPVIEKMPSISQLKLKPIRCNSKQLYKKKSRYRLSGVFNVNPISLDDSPRLSNECYDSESSPCASHTDFVNDNPGEVNMFPPKTPIPLTKTNGFAKLSYESSASNTEASFGGVHSINCFTEDTGADQLPPPNASYDMCLPFLTRNRSNSVPCIGLEAATNTYPIGCDNQERHQSKDKHLRHFISYPRIPLANKAVLTRCDQESLMSAISIDDDRQPRDCNIDFAAYLRSAPEEFNELLPLRRVRSQDSIFNEPKHVIKYRNPAEGLRPIVREPSPTLDSVLPTATPVNNLQSGDSRSLLTHVMRRNTSFPAVVTPSQTPPNDFSKKQLNEGSPIESFGKSISNSFRNFLSTSPKKQKQLMPKKAVRFEMPQTPIRAPNSIQEKRMPINIPRTDGAHSQLTIGPGLLRILKHGDSLVFKRPATLNLRPDYLHDALEPTFI